MYLQEHIGHLLMGNSSFSFPSFCLFMLFMGFSRQEYWSGLPFFSPAGLFLSELSTMTHSSWVALRGMVHSFIELDKANLLERLLRVPWTARRSNQSILKEISPDCSLEGLMLKLKLQYFGHLMQRADSSEKTPMLGKFEGRRRKGWQRMRWLYGITDSIDMSLGKFRELVIDREPCVLWSMGLQRVRHDWVTEWTELKHICENKILL